MQGFVTISLLFHPKPLRGTAGDRLRGVCASEMRMERSGSRDMGWKPERVSERERVNHSVEPSNRKTQIMLAKIFPWDT
jgi:hypothetical protein